MKSKHNAANYPLARMSIGDIRAIYQLERAIFPKDAYSYPDLAALLLMPRMVNRKIVQPESGELLGFIAVADVWWRRNPAWVITLGVGQAHQNQGIGRRLLLAVEDELHAQRIRLTVRRANHPALHLYQRVGYTLLHVIPHYYRDGEDGLVMEKWV